MLRAKRAGRSASEVHEIDRQKYIYIYICMYIYTHILAYIYIHIDLCIHIYTHQIVAKYHSKDTEGALVWNNSPQLASRARDSSELAARLHRETWLRQPAFDQLSLSLGILTWSGIVPYSSYELCRGSAQHPARIKETDQGTADLRGQDPPRSLSSHLELFLRQGPDRLERHRFPWKQNSCPHWVVFLEVA